jgi:hypothetical protein
MCLPLEAKMSLFALDCAGPNCNMSCAGEVWEYVADGESSPDGESPRYASALSAVSVVQHWCNSHVTSQIRRHGASFRL